MAEVEVLDRGISLDGMMGEGWNYLEDLDFVGGDQVVNVLTEAVLARYNHDGAGCESEYLDCVREDISS